MAGSTLWGGLCMTPPIGSAHSGILRSSGATVIKLGPWEGETTGTVPSGWSPGIPGYLSTGRNDEPTIQDSNYVINGSKSYVAIENTGSGWFGAYRPYNTQSVYGNILIDSNGATFDGNSSKTAITAMDGSSNVQWELAAYTTGLSGARVDLIIKESDYVDSGTDGHAVVTDMQFNTSYEVKIEQTPTSFDVYVNGTLEYSKGSGMSGAANRLYYYMNDINSSVDWK